MATLLFAMIWKDLRLFMSDRRAVIVSFAVPIAIASFFGSIFKGAAENTAPARIATAIVDEDGSAIARSILDGARADDNFAVTTPDEAAARAAVQQGRTTVGVILPKGFGAAAAQAFFGGGEKASLTMIYDPSHATEMAMVRGILTQHVMQAVAREVFSPASGTALIDDTLARLDRSGMPPDQQASLRAMLGSVQKFYAAGGATSAGGQPPGLTMPYVVTAEPITDKGRAVYNGYAHSFAGMGIQFLLFAAANLGVEVLLERQRGLWKRLRSAPVSRLTLLIGKLASITIISLMTLLVSFAFAIVVFGVRVHGSVAGFFAVALASALMASTFGLLVAAVGRTPSATRGVTTFAILVMVMLGGAWVPTFVFPAWLQRLTVVVPPRWAVDGLDAMTWRGLGFAAAVTPTLILLAFAAVFWVVTIRCFRWEE